MSYRWYQQESIMSVADYYRNGGMGHPLIALPTGCHAAGHQILMHDGSVKAIEDIRVGERVMGPDSWPRTVLSLARGRQEMRRIVPTKGEPFVVNLEHKLNVKVVQQKRQASLSQQQRNETITVRQYEKGSKWYRHIRKLRRVPITFAHSEQSLPAYFVGAMLGDGSLSDGQVSFTGKETVLIDYIKCVANEQQCTTRLDRQNDVTRVRIIGKCHRDNRIQQTFKELELLRTNSYTVFIPQQYKVASEQQRLDLLAGLVDTDGYLDPCGVYEIVTVSKQLAQDIQFVARSLGIAASIGVGDAKLNGRFISKKYRVVLSGDIDRIPVKLEYKQASHRRQIKDVLCTGFKTEQLPEGDYYGFTLSGDHLYVDANFVVHHNTGKSHVIEGLHKMVWSHNPNARILNLVHVKELIEQNARKIKKAQPYADIGINCSGLKRRDVANQSVFASPPSIKNTVAHIGWRDMVIIDEAHMISPNEETLYRAILNELIATNPRCKAVGLTATAYRLGLGMLTDGGMFTDVTYDLTDFHGFNRLLSEGHLAPLYPKLPQNVMDLEGVGVSRSTGDFVQKALNSAVLRDNKLTYRILQEICASAYMCRSWLIFASGVEHSEVIAQMLNSMGIPTAAIHQGTKNRAALIEAFKRGEIRCLVNNNVLTTGFDYPPLDYIGMLRPTVSPGLWVQMLGRGTRPWTGGYLDINDTEQIYVPEVKRGCLVQDFAGNTPRLGPINDPVLPKKPGQKQAGDAPIKICGECGTYNHTSARECCFCGHEFPLTENLNTEASSDELIRSEKTPERDIRWHDVTATVYRKHVKTANNSISLRVDYYCGPEGPFSEYITFGHEPRSRQWFATKTWWQKRHKSDVPTSVDKALEMQTYLTSPVRIKVDHSEQWPRIKRREFLK